MIRLYEYITRYLGSNTRYIVPSDMSVLISQYTSSIYQAETVGQYFLSNDLGTEVMACQSQWSSPKQLSYTLEPTRYA